MTEAHPYAELLPPMSAGEYADLRASVAANGLREPIMLHADGRVLDGRHRQRACESLGVSPAVRTFAGTDAEALTYVLDLNLKRRHLSESQRAMLAARLATLDRGRPENTARAALTQEQAGERFHVSADSIQRARIVLTQAAPEIIAAVDAGALPVKQAVRAAQLPVPRQRQIVADLNSGGSVSTIVLRQSRIHRAAVIEAASVACPLSALGRTFPVLYADPPWAFEAWSAGGLLKAPEMQYPTLPVADICALPVADIAARDSVLFMWAVSAMFPEALDVVAAWGFTFKTFAVWVKPNIACGHWFRGQHEPLIAATRGAMPPPPDLHSSVFEGPASGGHSGKPVAVRDWIASAYPDVGRIELFARGPAVPGWTRWGQEAAAA
jgi:N6-adenosine-specific RNA methylase IME4